MFFNKDSRLIQKHHRSLLIGLLSQNADILPHPITPLFKMQNISKMSPDFFSNLEKMLWNRNLWNWNYTFNKTFQSNHRPTAHICSNWPIKIINNISYQVSDDYFLFHLSKDVFLSLQYTHHYNQYKYIKVLNLPVVQ